MRLSNLLSNEVNPGSAARTTAFSRVLGL
jgi:hypothetical protein